MEAATPLSPTAWATIRQSADPGLRGLALGYTLSPTAWAETFDDSNGCPKRQTQNAAPTRMSGVVAA